MEAIQIEHDAPIPTWFGIGGRAARLARPATAEALRECLAIDRDLRVLGDGANLLVDDDGVDNLVVSLTGGSLAGWTIDATSGRVQAGAGANLPKLILATVRLGLAGLEGLGGIPASVGGAAIMNAGGSFGQFADAVSVVRALDRDGNTVELSRDQVAFGYRTSGLTNLILTGVELRLTPADPAPLRERLREVMAYKKRSQPMASPSAGCVFKNPTLRCGLDGIGAAGTRVSAGMLIDRAGCKGLSSGGARVSDVHANFITTGAQARARDVINLMRSVSATVLDRFGVCLDPEVVVWSKSP